MSKSLVHKKSLALTMAAVLCAGLPAFAQVSIISGNLSPTPTFDASPTPQWSVVNGDLRGSVVTNSGSWVYGPTWGTAPATFDWTGNTLDQDLSAGGLASGTFNPGGTFTIDGELYDSSIEFIANLIIDGPIFEADVSGFSVEELFSDENKLQLIGTIVLTPTGGYLFDQGLTAPAYEMSFQAVQAEQVTQQGVGPLSDFQSDIVTIAQLQFTSFAIPEPVTGLLCLLGGLLMLVRRRR